MIWTLPRTEARPCGCDWDVLVFGHQYCWTSASGFKHVICMCRLCRCYCHTPAG